MKIRPIHEDDWHAILAIEQAAYTDIAPESQEALRSRNILAPETCFVAVNEAGEILGSCLAHRWVANGSPTLHEMLSSLPESKNLYLHDLAVAPTARGTGVASALCRELLARAGQHRFVSVTLVSVQNSAGFWKKFGFQEVPSVQASPSYGADAAFMRLNLASRSFS